MEAVAVVEGWGRGHVVGIILAVAAQVRVLPAVVALQEVVGLAVRASIFARKRVAKHAGTELDLMQLVLELRIGGQDLGELRANAQFAVHLFGDVQLGVVLKKSHRERGRKWVRCVLRVRRKHKDLCDVGKPGKEEAVSRKKKVPLTRIGAAVAGAVTSGLTRDWNKQEDKNKDGN